MDIGECSPHGRKHHSLHLFPHSFFPFLIQSIQNADEFPVGSSHGPASQSNPLSNACLALLTPHLSLTMCVNPRHFSQLSWNVSYSINETCHYSDLCQFPVFTRYLTYGIPNIHNNNKGEVLSSFLKPVLLLLDNVVFWKVSCMTYI